MKKIIFIFLALIVVCPSTVFAEKESIVLMPIRATGIKKSMWSAMESAVAEGLSKRYQVYTGKRVVDKVKEIYSKVGSETPAGQECDDTRCLQDIGIAFQTELIAVASIVKEGKGFFLTLNITNVFDDKLVYAKSLVCDECDQSRVVGKLKIIGSGAGAKSVLKDKKTGRKNRWYLSALVNSDCGQLDVGMKISRGSRHYLGLFVTECDYTEGIEGTPTYADGGFDTGGIKYLYEMFSTNSMSLSPGIVLGPWEEEVDKSDTYGDYGGNVGLTLQFSIGYEHFRVIAIDTYYLGDDDDKMEFKHQLLVGAQVSF